MDCDKLVTIKMENIICTCHQQTAFDHQCCHELCAEGGFDIDRFGHRWLNEKTFQQMHPTFWLDDHLPLLLTDDASAEET
jgi:hypothetical protein